jgi:hypothetical protein
VPVSHVATYTDTSTGGGEVSVTVTGVAVGDGLLVFAANAYTLRANLDLNASASLAGTWYPAGDLLGDAEAPNYLNQNLGARLFVPSASGSCDITLTETNENVLIVEHVRAPSGYLPTVADFSDHTGSQSGGGPSATQALGPVDSVTDGLLVGCWAGIRFAANSWSTPAGMTERADLGDGANTQTVMVATESTSSTGQSRSSTATLAPSSGFAGKLVVIGTEAAATTGAVAGQAPRATGALAAMQTDVGAVAGQAPRAVGALAASQTTAGAVAGSAPRAAGALAAGQSMTGALAGQAPRAAGALAAGLGITGEFAGQAPRAVGRLEQVPPPVNLRLPLRAGTPSLSPGWGCGSVSTQDGWSSGPVTAAAGWRAGSVSTEDEPAPAGYGQSPYGEGPYGE